MRIIIFSISQQSQAGYAKIIKSQMQALATREILHSNLRMEDDTPDYWMRIPLSGSSSAASYWR